MTFDDERSVDHQLQQLISDSIPNDVEQQLRLQFADFQSDLDSRLTLACRANRRNSRVWLPLSITTLFVALFAVGLIFYPQRGLGQVASAVMKQPWVHIQAMSSDGTFSEEGWVSLEKGIAASRNDKLLKYEDHRLKIYHVYKRDQQILYRVPIYGTPESDQIEGLFDTLEILMNSSTEKRLEYLPFPGACESIKVVSQQEESVVEHGKKWLDFHLSLRFQNRPELVQMVFHVDDTTKLLQSVLMESRVDGKLVMRETKFDYPEQGPVDIYELGAPKTARLVDRVPRDDLKRIADTIKAGQVQMDDYRAVFIKAYEFDGKESNWWQGFPEVFSRKGNCFRRDFVAVGIQDHPPITPGENIDRREWWLQRAKDLQYLPCSLQRGNMVFNCERKLVDGRVDAEHAEISAVNSYQWGAWDEFPIPIDWAMRPEFTCRPPMGLGGEDIDAELDLHPSEGPEGSVLMTTRHTSKEGRVNEKGVGIPDLIRYWLDPKQDFIVKRMDMVMLDDSGKESISHQQEIEETARSPQGVWYATKVRLRNAVRTQDGKMHDQLYLIYVDFGAKLPDQLFEPPKPHARPIKLD